MSTEKQEMLLEMYPAYRGSGGAGVQGNMGAYPKNLTQMGWVKAVEFLLTMADIKRSYHEAIIEGKPIN